MTHGVDLGARFRSAGRKEISRRDRVTAVGLGMNANDLAAEVVGVARRFLRVPRHAARPLVDGSVARSKGIRVVPGRHVEIAFGVEGDRSTGVAALQALRSALEHDLLGFELERVAPHVKTSENVLGLRSGW